jgi:Na+/proline symporter
MLILGIFISCLFSGALSTFDSAIHSMAVVTTEELLTLTRFRFMSEKQKTTATKYICVFYGMIAMATALALPSLSMFLTVAGTFLGATLGPMFAYIAVSVTMPFVNLKGSMLGLCCGLAINIWLSAGNTTERLTFPRLPLAMDNCSLRFVMFS